MWVNTTMQLTDQLVQYHTYPFITWQYIFAYLSTVLVGHIKGVVSYEADVIFVLSCNDTIFLIDIPHKTSITSILLHI